MTRASKLKKNRRPHLEQQLHRCLASVMLVSPKGRNFERVTITEVKLSADLSLARVYFSVFEGVNLEETTCRLEGEAGFFRKMLATKLNLRLTPRLTFVFDDSLLKGNRIAALIEQAETIE
jgi:ribosome-binding factor A